MKETNKEIEKTLTEMDSLMGVLYSQFKDMISTLGKVLEEKKVLNSDLETHNSSDSSSNDDLFAKIFSMVERLLVSEKDIEARLNHLFDNSQPALNKEKELSYSFYELKEILTKIVNELPSLVNEKGEINQKSLVPLINISKALEKLKNSEEKRITISDELGDGNFYELVKKSESDKQILEAEKNVEKEPENSREKIKSLEELKNQLLEEIRILTGEEKEEVDAMKEWLAKKEKKLERLSKLESSKGDVKSGKLSELTEENLQLRQQISNLQKQLATKPASPEVGKDGIAKKKIQTELDKFSKIKIEDMSDEECFGLFDTFETMENWIVTGSEEEIEASINKQPELKKITNKLGLEVYRREWKQEINHALKDEYEEEEERIELENIDLTKIEYVDFEKTLKEKTSEKEMDTFGYKVISDIYEQRQKHENIINVLNEGKVALENKDVEHAKEVLSYLQFLEKLPGQKERQVFRSNKIIAINRLKQSMNSLIQSSQQEQQAQIIQITK